MLEIIEARKIYLKNMYDKSHEDLIEFAKKYDSLDQMNDETKSSYFTKLADSYTLGARISVCDNEDIVCGDDVEEVVKQIAESRKDLLALAMSEEFPTLPDDPYAEYGKEGSERLHRALLFTMADECDALLQLIEITKHFKEVEDENGGVSLDGLVDVLNRSGMKITKGELAAQLEYDGLLDKNNKPTQKAIDEGLFRPLEDDDS